MFKKTLLAASLAALSTGAFAVDVATNSTTVKYGYEGIASGDTKNDGTALTLGATVLTLGAEYSVGDTITINLAGGEFDPTDVFQLVDANAGGAGNPAITAGLLSATKTQLLFRITEIDTSGGGSTSTIGQQMNLQVSGPAALPVVLTGTAIGDKMTVSANAATSTGLSIDVAGATKDSFVVGTVTQQHKYTISTATDLDEQIDVSKGRTVFVGGTSDNFVVAYAATAVDQAGFTVTDTTWKINGSMTGFEASIAAASNDGTIVGAAAGALTVAADRQSASKKVTAAAAGDTFTFTVDPTVADRVALDVGSYTLDATIADASGDSVTYSGMSAGAWSLNGSSAVYAYAPVGFDSVTTQFEIGNKGSVSGDISLSAFDTDGNTYSATLPFQAEAGKLTRVSDADIVDAFGLTEGTKLKLTITVDAPTGDITYGAYSNRGTTGRMAINKL
jgi:hypothetical protein